MQRIAVRIVLIHRDKILVLRRSDGRQSILGHYELPGGRVLSGEQPEDALRRWLKESAGIAELPEPLLYDAFTYTDADDRDIQYAVITYQAVVADAQRAIKLGLHYDKYVWYQPGKLAPEQLTELTQLVLGASPTALDHGVMPQVGATPLLYTDGGSRGNPGPSATGYVLIDSNGAIVAEGGEYLGITTNNQAEYQAVKLGLEAALAYGWRSLECRIDSMLVVQQLNGVYKIKNRDLWPIHERIKELITQFDKISFVHVPRRQNQLADSMVNKTLDAAQ